MEKNFKEVFTKKFIYRYGTITDIKKGAFSMHTHNLYELIYFIKGDATHVIEDRKYKLSKNDLVLISPSKYHYIQIDSSKEYERFNILFSIDAFGFDKIDEFKTDVEVVNLSSNVIAKEIFEKLNFYYNNLNEKAFEEVAILLIKELFYNLSVYKTENEKYYSTLTPILSSALNYINDNLFTLKGIEEISEKLFITQSYLFKLFKQELKTTPKKYITDKRLLAAQNMLILGKTPTEVYCECGYNDYTAFYRSYVKFFGYPPSTEHKI